MSAVARKQEAVAREIADLAEFDLAVLVARWEAL